MSKEKAAPKTAPAAKASAVDYRRQLEFFQPFGFNKQVDIIGAGATGSHLAYVLAKMGVPNMRVYDFDNIEEHNVPNQLYSVADVGRPKVEALKDIIERMTSMKIEANNLKIETGVEYTAGNIVFLLTDTMKSRKDIFKSFLKLRPQVELVVETRMGADSGRVYAFNPFKPSQASEWEKTLYEDSEAETSLCGTSVSVCCTAVTISSYATGQMFRHLKGEKVVNEFIFGLWPFVEVSQNIWAM
jgi:hypothetical protein